MYQIIDRCAIGGKTGYHVGIADDNLSVQDVIISVVAVINDKWKFHHHSCSVALAVGAGIGFVGRHTVVRSECIFHIVSIGPAENNDTTAGAFHFGSDVFPSTYGMQIMVLHLVWVNRDRIRQKWPVWVFRVFLAAVQQGQDAY